MPKAISYIRFSSKIQSKGDSLKRQTDLINKWLLDNPDVILSNKGYSDFGRSGFHGTHLKHQFGDLLDAVENGSITSGDYVLVEAIDRIGRLPTMKALNVITSICLKGVKIITLEDNQEYSEDSISTNAGIIYYLIGKIDMAHNYSKNLSRRVGSAWNTKRQNAESGLGVNRKSFWYITKDEEGKFNQITPQDKALVHKIFTMFLSGVSQNKIVAFLKEHDPVRFKTYSATALKKLLINKTAIGYWEDTPNVYEPSIEESLFYSAQNIFKERVEKYGTYKKGEGAKKGLAQGSKSNHLMSGLVACKQCGKNYSVRNQKHSATVMYCSNSSKGNCSNKKVIPIAIFNEFRMRTQNAYIQKIVKSKVNNDNQKLVVALDGKIDTVSKSIENFNDLVEAGSKSAGKRVMKLEAELEELQNQRVGLIASESPTATIENLKMAGLDMAKDPLILNAMLKQVGYKITAEGKTMYLDNDRMEYVKWLKPKKDPMVEAVIAAMTKDPEHTKKYAPDLTIDSVKPKGGYRVLFNEVIEDISIPHDNKLTLDEGIYQLITSSQP